MHEWPTCVLHNWAACYLPCRLVQSSLISATTSSSSITTIYTSPYIYIYAIGLQVLFNQKKEKLSAWPLTAIPSTGKLKQTARQGEVTSTYDLIFVLVGRNIWTIGHGHRRPRPASGQGERLDRYARHPCVIFIYICPYAENHRHLALPTSRFFFQIA